MIKLLREKGYTVYEAESRLENTQDVAAELDKTKPDYVIDAAGLVFSRFEILIVDRSAQRGLVRVPQGRRYSVPLRF